MWISREITATLRHQAAAYGAVLITGARQAGKTALLRRLYPHEAYVSLDLPRHADEAENSGDHFLERFSTPLILDEVQYAPRLFRALKVQIDAHPGQKGLYLLTGSQKFNLMQEVSESLAGRIAVLACHPLSAREIQQTFHLNDHPDVVLELMLQGGYPQIHGEQMDVDTFYSNYLVTYLQRDVRQLVRVRELRDFDRFLRLLSIRSGQLLSMNEFASEIGVTAHTIKNWLSVLEVSNIIYLLEPYYTNMSKRLIKKPKVYFLDTGLMLYLSGIRSAQELVNSPLLGNVFETFILNQILRHQANQGKSRPIYFYRDKEGVEVDFLIPQGTQMHLLEVKWSTDPPGSNRGFEKLKKLFHGENILTQTVVTPTQYGFQRYQETFQAGYLNPLEKVEVG